MGYGKRGVEARRSGGQRAAQSAPVLRARDLLDLDAIRPADALDAAPARAEPAERVVGGIRGFDRGHDRTRRLGVELLGENAALSQKGTGRGLPAVEPRQIAIGVRV